MSRSQTQGDQLARRASASYEDLVSNTITSLVAGLPMSVRDDDLKRARARLRVAFAQQSNPAQLEQCTPESIAGCIAMSAISGLFPGGNNPDVDIIPRRNKHKGNALELNWQISYRGYIRLCRRNAGWDMFSRCVFEGDEFDVEEGLHPRLHHKPLLRVGDDTLGDPKRAWELLRFAYVVIERPNLGPTFEWLDKGRIIARRKCAQSDVFWANWPTEQVLKTMSRFAGQRERFPTDDPARYAMGLDIAAEVKGPNIIGGSGPAPEISAESSSSRQLTAGMEALAGIPALQGSVEGDEVVSSLTPKKESKPEQASNPAMLSDSDIKYLEEICSRDPAIQIADLEARIGTSLPKLKAGKNELSGDLKTRVLGVIRKMKKREK